MAEAIRRARLPFSLVYASAALALAIYGVATTRYRFAVAGLLVAVLFGLVWIVGNWRLPQGDQHSDEQDSYTHGGVETDESPVD